MLNCYRNIFFKKFYKLIFYYKYNREDIMRDNLTFEDGLLLCKYIYQSAIEKTLNGVIEQEQIFYKAHDMLNKLDYNFNNERLDELLYILNMENIFTSI